MAAAGLWVRVETEFPVDPLVQAAPDGEWERAETIGTIDGGPAVLEPMSQGAKHIGVEIMWPRHGFVGSGWVAAEWEKAVAAVNRALRARPTSAEAGLRALLDEAPGDRARFAQLGAVNAWASVGAESLWREGETYSVAKVDQILDRRPDLAMTCAHPVAVEFGLSGDQPGWLAFFVSEPGQPVDRERLHTIVRRVTG